MFYIVFRNSLLSYLYVRFREMFTSVVEETAIFSVIVYLSPDYTLKLCFMKLESFIKFDHVARVKTLFHGTFWSSMKHIFG